MNKLLCIQFRSDAISIEQERSCIKKQLGDTVDTDFINALDAAIPWEQPEQVIANYSGMILGGSGEFDFDGNRSEADANRKISYTILQRLTPFLDTLFKQDIPTFAICYGHQLIGAYAGVPVVSDNTQKKTGTFSVHKKVVASSDPIFCELPETVLAQYGHKDVLTDVPEQAVLLMAGDEQCQVSALRYGDNIYTVQFHPELTAADMIARLKNSPDYLPEGVIAEELIKDDERVNKLLSNFVQRVAGV